MNTSRIRGIAKLLAQVHELDSGADDAFEVEAEDDLPFVQVGHWVALSGVSAGALALYWMLAMHLNRNRGDRYVWPTTAILAHLLGYSRGDKIKRFVDELVAIGAVRVIPVPDAGGPQKRNVYRLRRTPPAGYEGPVSLTEFYARLSEEYEEETAGQSVCPETGVHVTPETGGYVAPRAGGVTTRTSTNKNENDAPSARSASDARSASTSGSKGSSSSGSAASGKKKPSPLSPSQRQQVQTVRSLLPADLNSALPGRTPRNLSDAILDGLAAGQPRERTVEQLVAFRVMRRWDGYWAAKFYAGDLDDEQGRRRVVGPLMSMLKDTAECSSVSCDDRFDVFTGEACEACAMRLEDKRANRATEQGPVSEPTATVPRQTVVPLQCCDRCDRGFRSTDPGLCRGCREGVMA